MSTRYVRRLWASFASLALLALIPTGARSQAVNGTSQIITWSCTSSPCPWGSPLSGYALVWPSDLAPISARLGYATSAGVYLPDVNANRVTLSLSFGSATIYAGYPGAPSHRVVGSVSAGQAVAIDGLAPDEVASVQSSDTFGYQITVDPAEPPPTSGSLNSKFVTWTCASTPCPWGSPLSGHALVWPSDLAPSSTRLGYATSGGVYLAGISANRVTLSLLSGSASIIVGHPQAGSHRLLASLNAGQSVAISGLAADEVASVQSEVPFSYQITLGPIQQPPAGALNSALVTWTCTGSPCPWGSPLSGQALVWPTDLAPTSTRLGYSTSGGVYLPGVNANRVTLSVLSGSATIITGYPQADAHSVLASLGAGQSVTISGLAPDEVASVQSEGPFTYQITVSPPNPTDPEVVHSVPANWKCATPDCQGTDWLSTVITWPSWSAYENNNRSGENARTVFSATNGGLLYPYMGAWANGCEVTAVSGVVLIVEWQRGTDQWRQTWLQPGEVHTIALVAPEDGALIESYEGAYPGFSVRLRNCTPQPIR